MHPFKQNNNLDYLLGFHCTPALAGIKCANLFSICRKRFFAIERTLQHLNEHFNPKGIYIKRLCLCQDRALILVYGKAMLEETIYRPDHFPMLRNEGYPLEKGLDAVLEHLEARLRANSDFPHEIGIFLGYPLADVIGFRENHGKNYKLSGYWKVYGDESHAKKLFEKYTRCRNNVCSRINNGMSLDQIFKTA
ncbi:MAG: DUF3793 family protein [Peptostreptococcaceae bacterium]|nr:DUF3793 family protein [Peptostreptococcaceae bacterium]